MIRLIFIYFFLLFSQQATAQIVINEVCTDNESILQDEEGDFEDWIELYNTSNTAINLQGYWLSDDEDTPDKWSFPNISIPSNSYLLLFASGKDFIGQDIHTNFKVSKDGETLYLSNPQLILIETIEIPDLTEDKSYGRQPDGSSELIYFQIPSPAATNNNSPVFDYANIPEFTNNTFFNLDNIEVTINCNQPNCQIFYTTDGSEPDETSFLYNGAFFVDTTTTIRASSSTPTLLLSDPVTRTFFINTAHEIPIISLTTNPYNLWDYENGIFVKGPDADSISPFFGANFWEETEIPIHFEYFEDEELKIEYPLGAKIHGGSGARVRPQKPLRLIAKTSFGTTIIDYPFFKNRTNTTFERLVLRNASGDFNICHMRDPFLARYYINENLNLDAIAAQPVVIYINGVYWGIMYLREKMDRFYLQYNYGVDPDKIDLLEEDTAIIEGSFDIFDSHEDFIINNDLSVQSNFEIAAGYFDLDNLSDYIICQTFVNNTDWPSNNIKYWRPKVEGGKWRYLLFDMDVAMALAGYTKASANSFKSKMLREDVRMIPIFKSFLNNEGFRHYFINRYADLSNTSFREATFLEEVESSIDELYNEMFNHMPRWGKTHERWYTIETPRLIKFANERPMYARQYIMEYFELASQDSIRISTYPEGAGDIQVNSVNISKDQFPWSGFYFNDVPIQLTIQPEPGSTFSHWESNFSTTIISTDNTITIAPRHGETFTAVFNQNTVEASLDIFPNPAQNFLSLHLNAPELDAVQINIYDAAGRLVLGPIQKIATTGKNEFNFHLDAINRGLFFIQVVGSNFNISEKVIKME